MTASRVDVAALEAALGKATPGPWSYVTDSCDCGGGYPCSHEDWPHQIIGPKNANALASFPSTDNEINEIADLTIADAALIVAAVNALPDLLAEVTELRALVRAVEALHEPHLCSCEGRRWNEDENWEPEDCQRGREREEGAGLIPCGFCNHGGWNTDQWDKDGATSCEECDQNWPCPTASAVGAALNPQETGR